MCTCGYEPLKGADSMGMYQSDLQSSHHITIGITTLHDVLNQIIFSKSKGHLSGFYWVTINKMANLRAGILKKNNEGNLFC